jgi:hypothetical protein
MGVARALASLYWELSCASHSVVIEATFQFEENGTWCLSITESYPLLVIRLLMRHVASSQFSGETYTI